MTAAERAARTEAADALCVAAYDECGGPEVGAALVAVGGYGRAELAPHSDLDVVLVSDEGVDLGAVAEKVWYPIWDSGVAAGPLGAHAAGDGRPRPMPTCGWPPGCSTSVTWPATPT